jgi:hypothetical protein
MGFRPERTPPTLRVLEEDDDGFKERECPLGNNVKQRAFEPASSLFAGFSSRDFRLDVDLGSLEPAIAVKDVLPRRLARLHPSRHQLFIARGEDTIILPAILLIEALWLWSSRAIDHLLVPGALDTCVGRIASDDTSHIASEMISPERGITELRRVAWLSQDPSARRSWDSVLTHALSGWVGMTPPQARLRAWAWGVELPAGTLVAEIDAVTIEHDLPQPAAKLRIGKTLRSIPRPPLPAVGLPSFL